MTYDAGPGPTPPRDANAPGPDSNAVRRWLRAHWVPVVLAILVIIFVAENRDRVSVDILFVHVRSWLWLILAVTTAIGVLIGLSLARRRANSAKKAARNP